jgi:hypothetical protein
VDYIDFMLETFACNICVLILLFFTLKYQIIHQHLKFMKLSLSALLLFILSIGFSFAGVLPNKGRNVEYTQSLTKAELKELKEKGRIVKSYTFENAYDHTIGTLVVEATGKKNEYKFVEVGEWVEKYTHLDYEGELMQVIKFDTLGNILNSKTLAKFVNTEEYLLVNEVEVSQEEIDGKMQYVQNVKSYHENGQLKKEATFLLPDFDVASSYFFKRRVAIKNTNLYNENGSLTTVLVYNNNGKLLKKRSGDEVKDVVTASR